MDEANILSRAGLRHLAGGEGVQLKSLSLFLLSPVDGGIGRSIDHGAGLDLSNQSAGVTASGQIHGLTTGKDHGDLLGARQTRQLLGHLARAAKDEDRGAWHRVKRARRRS